MLPSASNSEWAGNFPLLIKITRKSEDCFWYHCTARLKAMLNKWKQNTFPKQVLFDLVLFFFGPLLWINSVWHSTGVFRFEKWNVIAWFEKRTQTQSGAPEPGPSRSLGQPEGGPVTWGHSWGACLSPSKTVQLSAQLLTAWVVTASPPGMVRAGRSHHLTACPFHSPPQPAVGIALWDTRVHPGVTWIAKSSANLFHL